MPHAANPSQVKSIEWKNDGLYILDQTQLPVDVIVEKQETIEQVWDSIKQLKVRGAPAIGIAGAYGLVISMQKKNELDRNSFINTLKKKADYLNSARPTAVNLSWALKRVVKKAEESETIVGKNLFEVINNEAIRIHREDEQLCKRIGKNGVGLITQGTGVLTHCNAGRLATSEYGTATAPMYLAHEKGIEFRVYSDESRPLLQGSRLTSWELQQAGIDVTVITDSMAASMMNQGLIDLVIVGTDRIAANGDIANKIGTLGVAILAKYYNIPFYVAAPFSTIDLETSKGSDITIEERGPEEVIHFGKRQTAPDGIKVRNPAFDVTPNELVTGIITDKALITPPFADHLKEVFYART